ncbi:MAG TPA: hypothetical protein PLP17_09080, partial [Oligoflexia bacterium]|nr:hypothetical protein [Oligoflexia bacterium]
MKNKVRLQTVLLAFLVGLGASILAGRCLVDRASRVALAAMDRTLDAYGVRISQLLLQDARILLPGGVSFDGLSLVASMPGMESSSKRQSYGLSAESIAVNLVDLKPARAVIQFQARNFILAERLRSQKVNAGSNYSGESPPIQGDLFSIVARIDLRRIRPSVYHLLQNVLRFAREGEGPEQIEFHGKSYIQVGSELFPVSFGTVQSGGATRMLINMRDVREAMVHAPEKVTEEEYKVFNKHPTLAAQMMRLREAANSATRYACRLNPGLPQEPYRRMFYSYALTKQLGADKAREAVEAYARRMSREQAAAFAAIQREVELGRKYAV